MAEIYALIDPRTDAVRYIGKANNAAKRLKGHLRDARRRDTPVYCWIRSLLAAGFTPQLRIFETCADADWRETERLYIEAARRRRANILNLADGGDEPFCPTEVRAENGRKNAVARVSTPERARIYALKRRIGTYLRRGWMTEGAKAKLREAARRSPRLFGEWANV